MIGFIARPMRVEVQPRAMSINSNRHEFEAAGYQMAPPDSVEQARQHQRTERARILTDLLEDGSLHLFAKYLREWHADDPAVLHALEPKVLYRAEGALWRKEQ